MADTTVLRTVQLRRVSDLTDTCQQRRGDQRDSDLHPGVLYSLVVVMAVLGSLMLHLWTVSNGGSSANVVTSVGCGNGVTWAVFILCSVVDISVGSLGLR